MGLGEGTLVLRFGVFARTDSRPCVVCPPSMAASYFLLLVQEKVTKENTHSDSRPRLRRGFATGGRVSPTGHPWPVVEIGAIPRAARVRCTRLVRPPFAAAQREPEGERRKHRIYATGFCGRDCRALPFPGPSRPRRAGAGNSRVHRTRARARCAR